MTSSRGIRYPHLRILASKTYLHLLIIAVTGVAAYSNTLRVPFEFDDFDMIQNNLMIRNFENFLLALRGHDFASTAYQYSPGRFVGYFSFAVNYYVGGVDVKGYHLVNLFIHIVNAFLVYYFVVMTLRTPFFRRETSDLKHETSGPQGQESKTDSLFTIHYSRSFIALFSALLFVSHPVQTQAVTYIVQRFASLATLFYLLSVLMYIKGRLRQVEVKVDSAFTFTCFSLSFVFAVLAMRTKEIAYTLPFVIFLFETTFFTAPLKKRLLFILLPVVLILVLVSVSVIQSDKLLGEILYGMEKTTRAETDMPRGDYLMTEIRVIVTYFRLIFLPINQSLDYDYPKYHSLFEPPVFMSFLFLLSMFGAAVYLMYRSRRSAASASRSDDSRFTIHDLRSSDGSLFTFHYLRLVAFGILWFFITLSVESSIIPIKDVISEHRLYLPSVGFLTAMTAGIYTVATRLRREKSAALMLVLIIMALSLATYARNNIWKDRVSLWEDVIKKSPNLARSHTGLGAVYYRQGRLDEAMKEFQIALSLNFSDFIAHYDIGLIYWQQGRVDEAKKEFQVAVWLRPDNADMHYTLGRAYERKGFMEDAIREYQAALRLNPDHVDARRNLEVLDRKTGDNINR